jgi:predicted dehydrogenase
MNATIQGVIRTLLVGYGNMGKKYHFPLLMDSPEASLVGIVRASNKEVAPGIPLFLSLERALEEVKPYLAIISTPHCFHYEQTKLCLEHDCHVLVEKPLSLYYSEAEHLVRLSEKRERLLIVGLQRRYEGLATIFRRLKAEGKIGEIKLVHGLFAHRFSALELKGWRSDPKLAGAGGIVDDTGLHLIDLLLYFAGGKVQNLQARVLDDEGGTRPHSFTCFFNTDSGATVAACGSYLSPVNSVQEEISIWGTKGALFARRFCKEWNTNPPAVFFKSVDGTEKEDFDLSELPFGSKLPLKALLSVLAGQAPRDILQTEAKDTLETHRTIESIRSNLSRGKYCRSKYLGDISL